ncbi:hypothetical protein BAE44_0021643 [Dichanthelium oligosanthes]|uniref:Uncharacterized protein n=1 Tax=Dichanthelium oligosanthes TaxID=888268 RepID=A0A1E5UWT1_9POAL|nr:hypothetical protein BAE44_0021643 [Dichanthelium oligosanthes]
MRRLKPSRQYLHLVTGGLRGKMYSLRRMDTSRLFYPSTAEAEAAAAGAAGADELVGAEAIGRLRWSKLERGIHFQPPTSDDGSFDVFARLGDVGSRIRCADAAGHAAVYDAEARSFVGMPAMSSRSARYVAVSLPPPPFLLGPESRVRGPRAQPLRGGRRIGGGTSICLSTATATYSFDTATSERTKAGDWVLRFSGKAEHVPELGLWFAMSRTSLSCSGLYALDLSAAGDAPPTTMYDAGFDLELPEDWFLFNHGVVSLGSGRLCVANFFLIMKQEHENDNPIGVFTGVEVVPDDDGPRAPHLPLSMTTKF